MIKMYQTYSNLGNNPQENKDIFDVTEISNFAELEQILNTHSVVCVDIYADWCGPCKQTAPAYANLVGQFNQQGRCAMVKYNYDKMQPSEKTGINGIPVFRFYFEGKKTEEIVGADIPAVEKTMKKKFEMLNNRVRVEDLTHGPTYNRASIRQNRSSIPETDGGFSAQPYDPNKNVYGRTI